jgi:hypothetical protein
MGFRQLVGLHAIFVRDVEAGYNSFGWGWSPGMGGCTPYWNNGGAYLMNVGSHPGWWNAPIVPRHEPPHHYPGPIHGRPAPVCCGEPAHKRAGQPGAARARHWGSSGAGRSDDYSASCAGRQAGVRAHRGWRDRGWWGIRRAPDGRVWRAGISGANHSLCQRKCEDGQSGRGKNVELFNKWLASVVFRLERVGTPQRRLAIPQAVVAAVTRVLAAAVAAVTRVVAAVVEGGGGHSGGGGGGGGGGGSHK